MLKPASTPNPTPTKSTANQERVESLITFPVFITLSQSNIYTTKRHDLYKLLQKDNEYYIVKKIMEHDSPRAKDYHNNSQVNWIRQEKSKSNSILYT